MPADQKQIAREKLTIEKMMAIYCRGHRHAAAGICNDCGAIVSYAFQRIENCPFNGSPKPACGLCPTNCFTPDMHKRFSHIMRYAGPRMMMRHPMLTLAHLRDAVSGKLNG